jgi:hypothetical protein
MLVICSVPVPVLRKVTGSALLGWPTTSCPNIRLLADSVRPGAAPGMPLEQAVAMNIPIRIGATSRFIFVPPDKPDNGVSGPGKDNAEGNRAFYGWIVYLGGNSCQEMKAKQKKVFRTF